MLRTSTLSFATALAILTAGCMTTDPRTGEQKVDPLPTAAAVAGAAAVGALIYTATDDDNDDDHNHNHYRGHRRSRPFSPNPGVTCYPDQQRCYDQNGYAKKWTRRTFGD